MKKLVLLLGATIILYGCTDRTYKGYEPPEEEENTELVPVILSLGSPNYSVSTKGSGAIEGTDNDPVWRNAKVYIYSFLKGEDVDFSSPMQSVVSDNDIIIPHCLIDGSYDNPGSLLGKEANVVIESQSIKWTGTGSNSTVYFSTSKDPYDFYGYYIDDLTPANVQRTPNSISFEIEIDGSQDLMSSKAALTEEQETIINQMPEKDNILQSIYSSYTARRNIQPVLKFRHHLSRLKFQIFAGKEAANDVFVKKVRVESKVKGRFTVADKDISNIGIVFPEEYEKKILELKDAGGAPLMPDYNVRYKPEEASKTVFERTPVNLGESMLVAPSASYKFTIALEQAFGDERIPFITTDVLRLAEGATFEAGKEYIVRIAIYGVEEIKINVVPEGWQAGGNIDIDPDQFF